MLKYNGKIEVFFVTEPRVSSLFESYMTQVNEFNRSSDFPALVVGLTSRSEEIPGRVQSCFLHHLQVSAPTQGQRSAMLKSLSKSYHLSSNVDFTSLAQSTAGHVLRDFVALFSQAFDLAVRETLNHWLVKSHLKGTVVIFLVAALKQDRAILKT